MPGVPVVIPSRGGRKCIPESRQATTPTMKALPSSILSALLLVAPPIGAFSQEDSYVPGPDSAPQPGVPQGELVKFEFARSKVFPGTTRQVTVYVPRQYDPARPACVYVDQDGVQWNAPVVLDNLIARRELPVMIGVFVTPGVVAADNAARALSRFNRSFEYEGLGDAYARLILDEKGRMRSWMASRSQPGWGKRTRYSKVEPSGRVLGS